MRALAQIDFACNDPDDGNFAYEVSAIQYRIGTDFAEIEPVKNCGYRFSDRATSGHIRIHRRKYRYQRLKDWYGNWCWNAYWLPRSEAKRLLKDLRDSGLWRCTCAPTRFYHWFNRGDA
jgi:hypothetical protein